MFTYFIHLTSCFGSTEWDAHYTVMDTDTVMVHTDTVMQFIRAETARMTVLMLVQALSLFREFETT